MKFFRNIFYKKTKGSANLLIIICFILMGSGYIFDEILKNTKLNIQYWFLTLETKLRYSHYTFLIQKKVQNIILKKIVKSIDSNQELPTIDLLQKIYKDNLTKDEILWSITVEYINNNSSPLEFFDESSLDLKTMELYEYCENILIKTKFSYKNYEYYYVIGLKNLMELSNKIIIENN